MLTLGFLALSVGLVPLAILFALGRVWTLEVAFMRLAWVPLVALALQVTLSPDADSRLWLHRSATIDLYRQPLLRHRRCHASRCGPERQAASSTSPIHDARQRTWRAACRLHRGRLCPILANELSVRDERSDEHRDRHHLPSSASARFTLTRSARARSWILHHLDA